MANGRKVEVVESKDIYLSSRASGDGNLPWEGLPSGDKEATGPRSKLRWQLEVGTPETFLLPLVPIHPSINLAKVYTFILSVQPHYHKRALFWETGTAAFGHHPADSWAALCRRPGGHRPQIRPPHSHWDELVSTSSGLQQDHNNPWH